MSKTRYKGMMSRKSKFVSLFMIAAFTLVTALGINLSMYGAVNAGHNGAVVTTDGGTCEETVFSAKVDDPEGTHLVSNMYLVVHADGTTYRENIPTNGDSVDISVGPFSQDTTVSWRVFGGAERNYDQPLWNGFGDPDFGAEVSAYAAEVGSFSWVIAGPDDPNPFTTWNEVDVSDCLPVEKSECKQGSWVDFAFRNQGQCIRFVNTGQDSR